MLTRLWAWLVRCLWWQGKVFDPGTATMKDRITPLRLRTLQAQVYAGDSRSDGRPVVVHDYSKTSLLARRRRDEIRMIEPGLWLGQAYWGDRRLFHFTLEPVDSRQARRRDRRAAILWLLSLLLVGYAWLRFTSDAPVRYEAPAEHFKRGSHGGERVSGIPYSIWKALPAIYPEMFPTGDYASFGFVYEAGFDLPIGVSQRRVQGVDRVFVNCAMCHVGTVRDSFDSEPRVFLGMPANGLLLAEFERALFAAVADERFAAANVMAQVAAMGHEDWINRALLSGFGIAMMREQLLKIRHRFRFMDRQPDWGPGRVDTFNSPKALMNFPIDDLPEREWIGTCDLPSIWLQRDREGMQLHWDGNNTSLRERNLSASFGTGVFPPTLDRDELKRIEDWLLDLEPPAYPYAIDRDLADQGAPIYARLCADCHGKNGRDFAGARVGKVVPIDEIGTDRWRLDSYSPRLSRAQNTLYAGYDERFRHFRKTFGYANMPLDGVWLRAPYLHNGSVPTLRDLLEPAAQRPATFFRGNDVYDRTRVGFECATPRETRTARDGREYVREYFLFDTSVPGNGRQGHEGTDYGTDLSDAEKDALVEYLKTF